MPAWHRGIRRIAANGYSKDIAPRTIYSRSAMLVAFLFERLPQTIQENFGSTSNFAALCEYGVIQLPDLIVGEI